MQSSHSLNNLKIIMLHQSLQMGGAERQGLHLAQWLRKQHNANIEVWGIGHLGSVTVWCEDNDIPWRIFPWNWRSKSISSLRGFIQLLLELRRSKPDILLPYTMPPNIICGLFWRLTDARICIWNQRDEGRQRFSPKIEKYAVSNTPWFVSNSFHAAEFLIKKLKVDAERIKVINNGIELAPPILNRSAWRSNLKIPHDSVVACMIANLHGFKDHSTLLQTWKQVVEESHASKPVLLLAGHDYGRGKKLKALTTRLNLSNHVRFLGHVEDISGLLTASDIGVFSSKKEGVPNGILECMAAGLPLVATDIPGNREALGEGNRSFLVEAGNADSMAQALTQLAINLHLRNSIGRINCERAKSLFSKELMCQRYCEVLIDALNQSNL